MAVAYYQQVDFALVEGFQVDLEECVRSAEIAPEAGERVYRRGLKRSFRQRLLHRFPFSIIYKTGADGIVVVAISHHSRRPGYWHRRPD